jgi:hypothetical protein
MSADILQPLLQKIREDEKVPDAWKTGYLVTLSKKGDPSQRGNWQRIMFLSMASKLLSVIILERMKVTLDKKLRSEKQGSAETDHILTKLLHCVSSPNSP